MLQRKPKKLLLTGGSGFLGWNVLNHKQEKWLITGTTFTHSLQFQEQHKLIKLDITDRENLRATIDQIRPDAIIHTAAISDANYCQNNPEQPEAINVKSSINLAKLARDLGIPFLFTSSDLVFDGKEAPYSESDQPNPLSIYGEQKVKAEREIMATYPGATICRVPLMFGNAGPVAMSILQHTLRNLRAGNTLNLFTDEFRTPANAASVAAGLFLVLEKEVTGIIHLGGAESISRFNFGKLIADVFEIDNPEINPVLQKDLNLSAPRPANVSLNSDKAMAFGFKPKSIKEELEEIKKGEPLTHPST